MKYKAVLALLLDGARADVLARLVSAGELPTLRRHFADAGGMATATSVFPTVSGPAHLPVLAGVHPGTANLPGIRWAERPTGPRGSFLGRTRSYMAPGRAFKLERDVPGTIRTLFAYVPTMADVNTWFVRGCPPSARRTRWSKPAAFLRAFLTGNWQSSGNQAETALLRALDSGYTSVHAVFPTIDELGHRFGPLTEECYRAYRGFDQVLARVLDALSRDGRAQSTLIMISSDHGQTATHTHVDVDKVVASVYPRTVAYPRFWRFPFSAEAAVMVSGNSMANVYVRGETGWQTRPDFEAEGSRAQALVRTFLHHPAMEHVIYRAAEPATYVVAGKQGHRRIALRSSTTTPLIETTCDGQDPLGYGELPATGSPDQFAAMTADSEYPDALWQIVQFFRSSRAGDLIVNARHGHDLRARFEYQPHNGSHGGLHKDHMLVPALVNGRWARDRMRTVDLFPSILAALDLPVPPGLDGEAVAIDAG